MLFSYTAKVIRNLATSSNIGKFKASLFLKDVFILSITAFGGPQVHFVQFVQRFCEQKRLISKEELIELYSFCQILPGPTSTQTITALGLKLGGYKLAILTLLIWIFPATTLMSLIVLGYGQIKDLNIMHYFDYIPAMAVGFLFAAGLKMIPLIKKHYAFYLITLGSCFFMVLNHLYAKNAFTASIILPIILIVSAFISQKFINIKFESNKSPIGKINYQHLVIIILLFTAIVLVGNIFKIKEVLLFENTFRMGSLVFGGGQVLVPLMEAQFVHFNHDLTALQFAHGYGFLQAIPGPVFSFATFVNGMAMHGQGVGPQLLGCIIGTVGIFLPGLLIMFFAYPIWGRIKTYPIVQRSLDGVVAAAVGLILAAAVLLSQSLFIQLQLKNNYTGDMVVLISTIMLIVFTKIPSPFIVILSILASILF